MSKEYDALVLIGRFSPFHKGHEEIIREAQKRATRVVVLVGSSFTSRSIRNPFTFYERKEMIKTVFPDDGIKVIPLMDYPYDDNKWVAVVQSLVSAHAGGWTDRPKKIGLIGHDKDHTSYYLKMFPNWDSVDVDNYKNINATSIREMMFINTLAGAERYLWENKVSNDTMNYLKYDVMKTDWWEKLTEEYRLIAAYKEAWEAAPFPPTFVTTDTIVVQSGHILLVKRKAEPGIGLWALPGGFLNQEEKLLDGAIRELKEETKIKVPVPVLKGSVVRQHTFDAPHRSTRGRTITTAFYINLGFEGKLPKVTGADDAEKAVWVPFKDVDREQMFEDHFFIIDYFLNIG